MRRRIRLPLRRLFVVPQAAPLVLSIDHAKTLQDMPNEYLADIGPGVKKIVTRGAKARILQPEARPLHTSTPAIHHSHVHSRGAE